MDKELLNYTFVYKGWKEAFQEELNKPNRNEESLQQYITWDKTLIICFLDFELPFISAIITFVSISDISAK